MWGNEKDVRVLKLFILKEETEQEGDVIKNNRRWRVVKLPNKVNYIVHYWWCVDAFFMNAPEFSLFFLKKKLQLKWHKEVSGRVVIEMQKLEVEIGCKNERSTKL